MRIKKSLNILVLFILYGLMPYSLFVPEVFCADWVFLSTFKNGDLLYYDSDSIDKNSTNSVKVRTKAEYSKRGLEEEKKFMIEEGISDAELVRKGYDRLRYTIILWEMKCKENISCMLTITDYDKDEKVLISYITGKKSCDSIKPEATQIYTLFNMVCNKTAGVQGEDWISIGSNDMGLFLYDKGSVSKDEKGMISVTFKHIFSSRIARATEEVLPDLKGASFTISYDTIDCHKGIYDSTRTLYYDKLGNMIHDSEPDKEKYRPIGFRPIPFNTPIGRLSDIVCH